MVMQGISGPQLVTVRDSYDGFFACTKKPSRTVTTVTRATSGVRLCFVIFVKNRQFDDSPGIGSFVIISDAVIAF